MGSRYRDLAARMARRGDVRVMLVADPVADSVAIRERVQRITQECSCCWSSFGIDSWQREFLRSVESRTSLTDRQEETLTEIERKVFG